MAVFWLPVAGVRYAVARGAPNIFRRAALVVLVEVKTETGISQGGPGGSVSQVFLNVFSGVLLLECVPQVCLG